MLVNLTGLKFLPIDSWPRLLVTKPRSYRSVVFHKWPTGSPFRALLFCDQKLVPGEIFQT
jgi:hypothetical protein